MDWKPNALTVPGLGIKRSVLSGATFEEEPLDATCFMTHNRGMGNKLLYAQVKI